MMSRLDRETTRGWWEWRRDDFDMFIRFRSDTAKRVRGMCTSECVLTETRSGDSTV